MKNARSVFTGLLLMFSLQLFAQETVYSGKWERDSRWTTFEGSWKIVKQGDALMVIMGEDFEAKEAPDLKIFLSKAPLDKISGKNATSLGSPVLVAKLTSYKGKASYRIPAGINPADYASIIVHCEEYAKLWGGSPLK
jgi:hypothetical protein